MTLGRDVDSRADIYSLGCVGYWLLTGRPVFERASPVQLLIDHASTPPPRLSERSAAALPEGLEDLLWSCLQKEPGDRPRSVADLAEALGKISLPRPWTPPHAREWWLEHPVASALPEEETLALAQPAPVPGDRVGPAG